MEGVFDSGSATIPKARRAGTFFGTQERHEKKSMLAAVSFHEPCNFRCGSKLFGKLLLGNRLMDTF